MDKTKYIFSPIYYIGNKYKLLKEHNIKLLYFTKKKFYKEKIHEECTIFSINDLLKELEKEQ